MDQTCYCYNGEGELCYRHDGAECIDCEHFSSEGREAHALAEEVGRLRMALHAIAEMVVTADTHHAELSALCIFIAKEAIKGRE